MKLRRYFLIMILALAAASQSVASNAVRPAHGTKAMVATVHPEASKVGVAIMQQGGNAIDAAVAVGFALTVVYPEAGNIGGGGFLLFRRPDGEVHFLDYREKAPAKATANMYLDSQGNVIPDLSTIGYKAIGVPGSVAGLVYAQKHWGKLTLKQVMEPAIHLARDGFVLDYDEANAFRDSQLAEFPESHRIFQRDGDYYQQGDIFKQPELARTLERIADDPDDFYHGSLAKELGGFHRERGRSDYRRRSGAVSGEGAPADSRHLSRLRDHQRATAVVGRNRSGRDVSTFSKGTTWPSKAIVPRRAFT